MESLDTMNEYMGIDLSTCQTRIDKLKTIYNYDNQIFNSLFQYLTNEEKETYLPLFYNSYIDEFFSNKNDQEIVKYTISRYSDFSSYQIRHIIDFVENEESKFELLKRLMKDISCILYTPYIIELKSDKLKLSAINIMFKNREIESCIVDIIKSLKEDKNKMQFLPCVYDYNKVNIIKSFKNKETIKDFANRQNYENYKAELIESTKDSQYIKEEFKKNIDYKFRNELLELVKDKKLKLELIKLIDDKNIQYFILSNNDDFYNNYIKQLDENEISKANIDKNITIGVELECCNKNIDNYKEIKKVLKEFDIKSDASVKSGFEITSPILHFTKEDMDKLNSVCSLLNHCSFYTDSSCGGHIHIGSDYLKDPKEIYMLLYLYTNCEHIIYQICNKAYTKQRKGVKNHAEVTKDIYLKACEEGMFNQNIDKNQLAQILYKININRYKGINFFNIDDYSKHTIEFRMPNGEIEFKELFYNIKLFAKLIQRAHELAYLDTNNIKRKQVDLLSCYMPEKNRLEILLNILFENEEEKNVYKERYNANVDLLENFINKLFYKNEEFIEIDEYNKNLTKKK